MEDYSEILPQNNDESNENCDGATDAQLLWFDNFRYWTEGVVQLILGIVGFVANCLVIPVLRTKKMNSTFNHNLVYLAILTMFTSYVVFSNVYGPISIQPIFKRNYLSMVYISSKTLHSSAQCIKQLFWLSNAISLFRIQLNITWTTILLLLVMDPAISDLCSNTCFLLFSSVWFSIYQNFLNIILIKWNSSTSKKTRPKSIWNWTQQNCDSTTIMYFTT